MKLSNIETLSKTELQKIIQQHHAAYDDLDRNLRSVEKLANAQLNVHVEEAVAVD